ncbi:unnamed protein product [Diatraea saccharalis]|uniref:C2H2-type domain-containing protein n=1 Tax=Diatraea saccharalis TaxID=40085 RepID=A0A9P0C594_9NEOP|nr:unnamed protein product [Diatraea saccharalis]
METTVEVERLNGDDSPDFLPSHEILRENLKADRKKRAARKPLKKYKCRICEEIFDDITALESHAATHDPENPYACTKCPYKTNIKSYLTRHTMKVHNKSEHKQECEVCGKKFLYKSLMEQHLRVHTGEKPHKCDVCGKAFNTTFSLTTHKYIHNNEKPFKCSFCDHACRDSSSLRKHQSVHLGISKKYPCQECSNRYDTKARLQDHIKRAHRGIEPPKVTCNICGSIYKNKWTLMTHIRAIHDKSKACVCGICGKHLSNSSNLRSHMTSHLDIRPYKCFFPGCTIKFKDKYALKKHTRIHYPEQQVYCNECGRGFARKHRLVKHLAQHVPKVKDTKCPFCGVPFYNKNYLLKHLRTIHGNKREKYICDVCGFEASNKPGLVVHIRYVHKDMDKQCHLCKKTFKRKCNLTLHFRNTHGIMLKSNTKPMVVIKQEPLDFSQDLEIDLLDIDKEEPFAGFDIDSQDGSNISKPIELSGRLNSENKCVTNIDELDEKVEEFNTSTASRNIEEVQVDSTANAEVPQEATSNVDKQHKNERGTVFKTKEQLSIESKESETISQENKDLRKMHVDEFIQNLMSDTEIRGEEETKERSCEAESPRRSMQVDEFLQHVISDTELQEEETDHETEDLLKTRIKELIDESNFKNGIVPKETNYGKKLQRVHVDEITKFLFKDISIEVNGEVITQTEKKKETSVKKKKKKRKKQKRKGEEKEEWERNITLKDSMEDIKKAKLNRKCKTTHKKKCVSEETEDRENNTCREKEKDPNTKQNSTNSKIKFNSHQCYVCYKLFETKPQLIQHCKEHFDVCNEITLKKCPLCTFVTHHNIKRHMLLKHDVNINFSFMRIKDKKVNENGSRYYFDLDNKSIKKLEIIPSIKILNKKACMDLDKRNREIKDKSLLKRKLVRKGDSWIVETEKIDLTNHVVPKLKQNEKENYLVRMKKISLEAKRNNVKMLYPCNGCEKICQNLSALTLHMRRHDPNAKPFKPKKWKHKQPQELPEEKEVPELPPDNSNRHAKPRPIVNKHKCDPALKAFYENNIKGGDIEFWQFLKIYNKMDRENVNDFKDLESRSDFGLHFNNDVANQNNNTDKTTKVSSSNEIGSSNTEMSSNKRSVARKVAMNRIKQVKYVRKIQLSREEYKRRCEIKNKMRDKIASNTC